MAEVEANRPPNLIQLFGRQKLSAGHLSKLARAINRSNTGVDPPYQVLPPSPPFGQLLQNITITIDGGGSVIPAAMALGGATVEVPSVARILNWTIEGDVSGSIVVDVTRANKDVPATSIVGGGNKPTLSSAQYASAAPSGWTSVALAPGDIIGFSISGTPASVTRVTVTLRVAC
jgi:hypothetical protein